MLSDMDICGCRASFSDWPSTLDHIGFPFAPETDLYITAAKASACIDDMYQRDKVQSGPKLGNEM